MLQEKGTDSDAMVTSEESKQALKRFCEMFSARMLSASKTCFQLNKTKQSIEQDTEHLLGTQLQETK